jgi:hypothetical protein
VHSGCVRQGDSDSPAPRPGVPGRAIATCNRTVRAAHDGTGSWRRGETPSIAVNKTAAQVARTPHHEAEGRGPAKRTARRWRELTVSATRNRHRAATASAMRSPVRSRTADAPGQVPRAALWPTDSGRCTVRFVGQRRILRWSRRGRCHTGNNVQEGPDPWAIARGCIPAAGSGAVLASATVAMALGFRILPSPCLGCRPKAAGSAWRSPQLSAAWRLASLGMTVAATRPERWSGPR